MGPDQIRNVVLVGHGGSGKTALAEAMAHVSGLTTRLGRIEDGNTITDFEPEEIARESSVALAIVPIEWDGHKINIIDTPGYADFLGEALAALRACLLKPDAETMTPSSIRSLRRRRPATAANLLTMSMPTVLDQSFTSTAMRCRRRPGVSSST